MRVSLEFSASRISTSRIDAARMAGYNHRRLSAILAAHGLIFSSDSEVRIFGKFGCALDGVLTCTSYFARGVWLGAWLLLDSPWPRLDAAAEVAP